MNHHEKDADPGSARLQPGAIGWHSRGYLPHFNSPHAVQHVTFHLADSLPAEVLLRFEAELRASPFALRDIERRKLIETWIDAGHGSCVLRDAKVAHMVEASLVRFDGERYRLFAWVVMPNHVHVLFQTLGVWTMARIVASWKSFTGRRINAMKRPQRDQGRTEPCVWYREYWDRYIRNERHFRKAVEYIHNNPVKARLVQSPEEWPWSTARLEPGAPRVPQVSRCRSDR